ncbi:hypothetical protein KCP71_19245 [Salmonella enterica subsp. enterica]|nr:hypothetical protein KCP71_19245 [Salmonella enterica subsp. enterica]
MTGFQHPANGRPGADGAVDLAPPAHCWLSRQLCGRRRKEAAAGAIETMAYELARTGYRHFRSVVKP